MKKLLLLIGFLISATPAHATWTLVQVKTNLSCAAGAGCTITVTSTGSGHVLVVAAASGANETISGVSGGGTWTLCGASCRAGDSTAGWMDMAYTLNSTSGATSIIVTYSGGAAHIPVVWEYSFTSGPVTFDTGAALLDAVNCTTTCAGTGLTLTGSNDAISTFASCGGSCSAVSAPYTNDLANPNGDGAAHSINTSSGAAPTFTQSPTSHLVSAAIAIKETSVAGSPTMPPLVARNRK